MARKEAPKIFAGGSLRQISTEQPLKRFGYFSCGAAVSNRAGRGLMKAKCTANAEVVGIDHLPIDFELLAFNADVGNPVLPTAVRAAGDMKFEMLVETRQSLLH